MQLQKRASGTNSNRVYITKGSNILNYKYDLNAVTETSVRDEQ